MASPVQEQSYTFPKADVIKGWLEKSPNLDDNYFKEKGISQAISERLAEKLAGQKLFEDGVKHSISLNIYDLVRGEDGYTDKKIKKIDLPMPQIMIPILVAGLTQHLCKQVKDKAGEEKTD